MLLNIPLQFPVVVIGILLLWNLLLSFVIWRIWRHYSTLTKGVNQKNLPTVLEHLLGKIKQLQQKIVELNSETKTLRQRSQKFIQKVKLMRYNPFKDVGGDQSFILALLDEEDSGIVISSLHSREHTRWFAKRVRHGKGVEHRLSEEEKKVIHG